MVVDIASWLGELGLSRYAQAFVDHHVDPMSLPLLRDEDLKDMGIRSLGHRKKILAAIGELSSLSLRVDREQGDEDDTAELMGERRQVTILFCDIAGFTRLSEVHDPEVTHAMLNAYFELVDSTVQRYGGHVDKHIGDAVMAVFGAPVAHTNDPERAVRAAFDIHRGVATLRYPVRVHIGIASGSVVASRTGSSTHREYTMTGRAVNLAAALEAHAEAGELLVSDAVQRHVAHWVTATPVDGVMLEGEDSPRRVWRLDGLRIKAASAPRTTFVGRTQELAAFTLVLDDVIARHSGRVLHVRGEAGIGKTRLVEEMRALAQARGVLCHRALVLDFGDGAGQSAISELTCSLLGVHRAGAPAERELALGRAVDSGLMAGHRDVYLYDLLDLPLPAAQRARYQAMTHPARSLGKRETLAELIRARAAGEPLLLVIEDIHWADAEILEHIAHLCRVIAALPVILVVTSRIQGDPLARVAELPAITALELSPLDPRDAAALAGHVVDAKTRMIEAYVERSGGNPLFLEQLLQSAEDLSQGAVPDSIQSIVQSRIDNLGPADKRALQTASVMGQRFSLAALRFLLGDPDYACDSLIEHHLLQPVGEDEYLFAHALVLEGVYSSLLRARQRQLHAQAAAWFAGRNPALYAEHLERAGDPSAPRAYLDAARKQADEYRLERALALCKRGLGLARHDAGVPAAARQGMEYELISLQGDILRKLGDIPGSLRAFERAEELAQTDLERCHAFIGLAEGMRIVDRTDDALAMLERAEPVARRLDLPDRLAAIHYLRGNLLFPRADIDGCLAQHTLAREHAIRAGSAELEARALSGLGDAAYMTGRMLTAYDFFDQCIELAREHGLAGIEAANLPMRSLTLVFQCRLSDALKDARDAVAATVLLSNKRAEILARGATLGVILFEMGRMAESSVELERALEVARSIGARRFDPLALIILSKIAAEEGRVEHAEALAEQALTICRETDFPFAGPATLGALAAITRDPGLRARALAEAEARLLAAPLSHNAVYFYRDAIEACLGAGDPDRAEAYARAFEDFTRAQPLPWPELLIARARLLAAHARGERSDAHLSALRALRDRTRAIGAHLAARALEHALATP